LVQLADPYREGSTEAKIISGGDVGSGRRATLRQSAALELSKYGYLHVYVAAAVGVEVPSYQALEEMEEK
jgi:hypothetical protein